MMQHMMPVSLLFFGYSTIGWMAARIRIDSNVL